MLTKTSEVLVGSVYVRRVIYLAPTFIEIKHVFASRKIKKINITLILRSDVYTSLNVPRECTYRIETRYVVFCILERSSSLKICDVRDLYVNVTLS